MTVDSLIELLGGTAIVSRALGAEQSTVSNWRARGKIPGEYWSEIEALARKLRVKGVTAQALTILHARPAADARS
jgi:hypothetical protein